MDDKWFATVTHAAVRVHTVAVASSRLIKGPRGRT
jgi:hypothetical protein